MSRERLSWLIAAIEELAVWVKKNEGRVDMPWYGPGSREIIRKWKKEGRDLWRQGFRPLPDYVPPWKSKRLPDEDPRRSHS